MVAQAMCKGNQSIYKRGGAWSCGQRTVGRTLGSQVRVPLGERVAVPGLIPATSLNMSVRRHDSTRCGALDQRLQAAVWRATAVLESLLRPARLHLLKGLYNGA